MKKVLVFVFVLSFLGMYGCTQKAAERWSEEKANEWYDAQEWPVGMNYVTSTAINQFEMWQDETFDPETIDRELGWAEGLGFNAVRIFLHDMVWEADPEGFKKRLEQFLEICDKYKMKAIITFFTNGGRFENPKLGPQPESVPGVHNSQWIQSPGSVKVNDPQAWPVLERYVKDILTTYTDDDRVLLWCLYNEPENLKLGAESLPLLREVFKWGREVNPSQPLTAPIWLLPGSQGTRTALDIVSFVGEHSDVMSFHCYYEPEVMETFIKMLKRFNRPLICTEYMGRPRSTFEEILPILKREKVGATNWGLVAGKCNFHLQWSSKAGDPEPEIWFHDIYRVDGTPYSQREVDFIRNLTADKSQTKQTDAVGEEI
ncbi:cellulase family glycosylhydrolase [Sphingobacterium phlebotomi]|uniref:Cellulase family glycosylhydrolase n=1 Tax=Sphingobacterium phlebotomi TaxID=2605433 RepID=A0A5D4HFU0_9SPHI|nr:cellulase family glycosylhydrolase [Sphingobacterium phlebotomi]TYR38465.1 cellulase family glycosylhydrolase [Sphingobacterium phlebotomi]